MTQVAIKSIMVRLRSLGLACLVTFAALPGAANSAELPDHCFYFDEKVPLDLVTDRLAVQYRADVAESRRAAIAEETGLSVRSAVGIGIGTWTSLELAIPLLDSEDASIAIRDLTNDPEVVFASPVFRTPLGGTVIPTSILLLRFRGDARADGRRILDTVVPGVRILQEQELLALSDQQPSFK